MTIAQIIGEPLRHADLSRAGRRRQVDESLADVGLVDLAERYPHELSGGQRQRVAIARAIIARPAFVVADEPVSALDMTVQKQVLTLLQRLQQEHGFACLFISHDLAAVEQIADRVIVMEHGRIIEAAASAELFAQPQREYTKALLAAAPTLPPRRPALHYCV